MLHRKQLYCLDQYQSIWLLQDKLKGKMGSSGTPTFCFTGRLLSTNNISFWCTLYATIAATIVTTLSVAKSVACGSSSSCSNISISSSSDASFTAENVETSAYGCNIAALTKLAGSRTASVHAITAVRGWLLANMDSLVMCGHPVERLLQPLHMKALECSWLDIFAIGVAAGAGLALKLLPVGKHC